MSESTSHVQILKSTTIIGSSSALNVVFRIVASKVVALIVGPSGVGMIGLFNSAISVAGTISGMGLAESSGVRQIAEAVSSGDEVRIARTMLVLQRISLTLGVLGSLIFFSLRSPISIFTFGSVAYAGSLGLLSINIFLTIISGMQMAFLRGMRRVSDMARVNVLGIAIGTCLGLPMLYFLGREGIAFYLLIISSMTFLFSLWYVQRIRIRGIFVSWYDTFIEARGMLGLGTVFMLSSLVTLATTYLVKVLVIREAGLESAGLFEASSSLANIYVGFILGAMAADFFPHLTMVAHDDVKSSELMNAQVEIGLLVAAPGILAMLALGPFLIQLLYSPAFILSFDILRWQVLGTFLRVISWPLAYIMLAKGKGALFFWSESISNLVYVGFASMGMKLFGLKGLGMAFFALYIFHTVLTFVLANWLVDFSLAKRNIFLMLVFFPVLLFAFGISLWMPLFSPINLILVLGVGVFSMRSLYDLLGPALVKAYLQRIRIKLGL